ncbi:MAG: hypothetical protein WCW01_05200 [Gammaproteobacteria bacterium]|jgi:hypothetical protein
MTTFAPFPNNLPPTPTFKRKNKDIKQQTGTPIVTPLPGTPSALDYTPAYIPDMPEPPAPPPTLKSLSLYRRKIPVRPKSPPDSPSLTMLTTGNLAIHQKPFPSDRSTLEYLTTTGHLAQKVKQIEKKLARETTTSTPQLKK